ncbi:amino acid adenylation domain-containing protein [Pararobbsia alpina]|uniref:Linear gramicidin synthase subunit D n=1 Tax=Pararobbsia alpina TaxID=621374 RepID=A0A6S7BJH8_9BURK|nr:amino acid adenylation domain-containing protein [Pararobbsia alpina]CAB3793335.1 Linear gramicidin synthase subunit D [Pararobbsia alpina]
MKTIHASTHQPIAASTPKAYAFLHDKLSHLTASDRYRFEDFGCGVRAIPAHGCIHHAFEHHARSRPESIAAEHLGETITYEELDRQANRLAALLAMHGVMPGENVALFVRRSIPMLVGILAILKAGAAYVPQHVRVAAETQLRHIVRTASTRVILTLADLRDSVPTSDGHLCIAIDTFMRTTGAHDVAGPTRFVPSRRPDPDDGCYVLFTSGTTGMPNGVRVTHRNVSNIVLTAPGDLGMRPNVRVAQILSIAFDMAAWEILGCLANGATLVIRDNDIARAIRQADVVIATPSILGTLDPNACINVKTVAVAGEPCPQSLAERWSAFCTFYNGCGPTETTIVNTMQQYRNDGRALTIGKPTPNNTVYILDAERQPCAIGEVGEMWAGGDGVSAGYLDQPALNAERYAPDPFLGGAHTMFRTRDLGRWTLDGELVHLGRVDDQVKVRGFRVELDSVSALIETVPSCAQAVTLKLNDRSLVSFVRPGDADVATAARQVGQNLPYYCVPAYVIAIDTFPLTFRGKIDKRALLSIALERRQTDTGLDHEQTASRIAECL